MDTIKSQKIDILEIFKKEVKNLKKDDIEDNISGLIATIKIHPNEKV